jgi:hypothetical protein
MDVAELADRTGLPARRLRYALDHRLLPGACPYPAGHGVPRTFTDFEGFGVALAARLLGAGLTRQLVAASLASACRRPRVGKAHAPLYCAYAASSGRLELGDGRFLRLWVTRRRGVADELDTGWLPLVAGDSAPERYTPTVLVSVELGALAKTVRGD